MRDHVDAVNSEIMQFVRSALAHVIKDERVRIEVYEAAPMTLQIHLHDAKEELGRLCHDEQLQPITYNHFTDNIQNARQEAPRKNGEEGHE